LSRKYAYLILILEEFQRLGVPILFLEQPPSDDPHMVLLTQIQGAVAEYERAKLAERYRRGKLHRASQGEVFWSFIPYGYRRVPRRDGTAAHLVVDADEAATVKSIFDWHANQATSIRQIAKRLTRSGVATPKGNSVWGETTVHRILHNEAYIGTIYYNRSQKVTVTPDDATPTRSRSGTRIVRRPKEDWIAVSIPPIVEGYEVRFSVES
jgi:site-specific DNA recombinase